MSADSAWAAADHAASRSDVEIRSLTDPDQVHAASQLLARVWRTETAQLNAATMRALEHSGNYVAGAFARSNPRQVIGCLVGFFSPPPQRSLHSHIAGVDPAVTATGIGAALKLHQRAWALDRTVTTISWTYDPAISRNAYFNLAKLGATATGYLTDFYGEVKDGINAGVPTDRLHVEWNLRASLQYRQEDQADYDTRPHIALAVDPSGGPQRHNVPTDATRILINIPRDIEQMRIDQPEQAAQWRFAIRDSLGSLMATNEWAVTGFNRKRTYLVERRP